MFLEKVLAFKIVRQSHGKDICPKTLSVKNIFVSVKTNETKFRFLFLCVASESILTLLANSEVLIQHKTRAIHGLVDPFVVIAP